MGKSIKIDDSKVRRPYPETPPDELKKKHEEAKNSKGKK